MLKIYSYVIEHDLGLAPNPFGGYCTLAVCKGAIRKSNNLNIGDWIIGTGSKSLEIKTSSPYIGKLIYAMKVEEKLTFNEYFIDKRFQDKKPNVRGTLFKMYGDNIYHCDNENIWHQADSAHSNHDGSVNQKHLKRDTDGKNVLISKSFFYFGDNAPDIPKNLIGVCHSGVGEKIIPEKYTATFLNWLNSNFSKGIHGDPVNWIKYNQLKLF